MSTYAGSIVDVAGRMAMTGCLFAGRGRTEQGGQAQGDE